MTATQGIAEYVMYRLRDGRINYVPRERWYGWSDNLKQHVGARLIAEGLTEQQAHDYCQMTKET